MNVTELELKMIHKIARSEFNQVNGGIPTDNEQTVTWTSDVVRTTEDKGVFSSLIKKGLVYHEGEGRDSTCMLTVTGFTIFEW